MDVFQTNRDGFFVGVVQADPDPLTEGSWLIPGGCVTVAPPSLDEDQRARWAGDDWEIVDPDPEAPEPTIEEIRAGAIARTLAHADQLGVLFIAGYPDSERQSWPKKQIEANLIAGGETDPAQFPVIAAEADITGETPADIAAWILSRAAVFEKAAGIISGFRQIAIAGIEAAEDAEGVEAALDAAKATAAAKLAELTA